MEYKRLRHNSYREFGDNGKIFSNICIMVLLSLALFSFSSCVAKKKFIDLESRRKSCEDKVVQLEKDIASSKKNNEECKTFLTDANKNIATLKEAIAEAGKINAVLQEQIDEILSEALSEKQKMDTALKMKLEELEKREKAIQEMQQLLEEKDKAMRSLLSSIEKAMKQYSSDELSVELVDGKVYVAISDKLLFKSGSAKVDIRGKEALAMLAGVLVKYPELDIIVEGHTDNVPIKTERFADNWDLSVIRATSVSRILSNEYGILPKLLTPAGRGEYFPKAPNDTQEGRAQNRRTEIIIAPNLNEIYNMLMQ